MKKNFFMTNHAFVRRATSLLMLVVFSLTTILLPAKASAQSIGIPGVNLPAVGSMLGVSSVFAPAIIRGMSVYPDNPLKFDFIVNTGDNNLKGQALEKESQKLIKYFLASLTTPENEFWVNLSPYEKDRIIPEGLGVTEMGRDMLAQDYILKQLTASLLYPEKDLGNKFWQSVREKAKKLYGVTEVPVNTFNKVWIMPDKAAVYESDNRVFVVERHLKVMLEQDYEAMASRGALSTPSDVASSVALDAGRLTLEKTTSLQRPSSSVSDVLRDLIIPEIEKEVNEGKNFAAVRQIYNSMILATWYKKRLKESLLGQVYVNQNKVKGIDLDDKQTKQKIYEQYLAAFKKGVYNYIKEDVDALTNEPIPTKYFSGGLTAGAVTLAGLRVYDGSLENQPKVVSAAVTEPLTDKGNDVVVSSTLVENANPDQVAAATQTNFTKASDTKATSSAIMEYPIAKSVIWFGRKGYKGTMPALLRLLGHRDAKIRSEAEEVLATLGATKSQMAKGYIAVYNGYSRAWEEAQAYAIQKSGELGDKQAIEPLLEQLKWNSWKPKANYTYAEQALEKLGVEKKQLADAYVAALEIEQVSTVYKREVIQKLGDLGDAQAIESLLPFLGRAEYLEDAQVALEKLNATKDQMIAEYRRVATYDDYWSKKAQENALTKLSQYGDVEFLISLLGSDKISDSTREKVNSILSQLGISDRRIEVYKEVVELLGDLPSWRAARVYTTVYGIVLAGNKFSVVYEPEVLRATGEWRSMDYGTTESQIYKEQVYEVEEPEVLKVVNLNTGEVTDLSASSTIDNLKLVGAADGLTVSGQGVSELQQDSLTARTSDAGSSAIMDLINNSVRLNILQLSPVFSTDRRLKAIGNLARLGDQRAREPIEALLMEDDVRIKSAAAEALGQLDDQNVKGQLLALLSHDSPQVRSSARDALDRLETANDQLIGGYIKALSASRQARLDAAKELAFLGRESDAAYEALKSLLQDTDPFVVSIAIGSFVAIGKKDIVPTLFEMLERETDPKLVAKLVFAMGAFNYRPAINHLKQLLKYDMPFDVIIQVIKALNKLGEPVSDEFFIEKIRRANQLSFADVESWKESGATQAQLVEGYHAVLAGLSLEESIGESIKVANKLADLGDQRGVRLVIEALKKKGERIDGYDIVEAGKNFVIEHIPAYEGEDSPEEYYDWKGTNYGHYKIGGHPESYSVREIKNSHSPAASSAIMPYKEALAVIEAGNMGSREVIPTLLELLGHENSSIREYAMGALERLDVPKEQIATGYLNAWPKLDSWGKINPLNWYPEIFKDARFIDVLSDELQGGLHRVAREALSKLEADNEKIRLYDSAEQRLRSVVPADESFSLFEEKVRQAYRILLAGDDFEAVYIRTMRDEYDYSGIYDTYSEPADPDNRWYKVLDSDSLRIERIPNRPDKGVASAGVVSPVGGIDFNSAALDLQIKRDGNGVALPLPQQTIQNMKIDGFYPVIINIAPVNIPLLLGQKSEKQPQQLSALR